MDARTHGYSVGGAASSSRRKQERKSLVRPWLSDFVARVEFAGTVRRNAKRPRGMASDLLFWSGCRDLNPGPLDPQSLKGGILR